LHYPPRRYGSATVSLDIPFPVTFIQPNPLVRHNEGRVAIRRGPFIYALESADNNVPLSDVEITHNLYLEEDITIQNIPVKRIHIPGKWGDKNITLKFIPYWSWGNRSEGDVQVWCKFI
jgi:uncharacterized protein